MTYTVLRDNERIATYHAKRSLMSLKAKRALRAFYKALYPQSTITIQRGV